MGHGGGFRNQNQTRREMMTRLGGGRSGYERLVLRHRPIRWRCLSTRSKRAGGFPRVRGVSLLPPGKGKSARVQPDPVVTVHRDPKAAGALADVVRNKPLVPSVRHRRTIITGRSSCSGASASTCSPVRGAGAPRTDRHRGGSGADRVDPARSAVAGDDPRALTRAVAPLALAS